MAASIQNITLGTVFTGTATQLIAEINKIKSAISGLQGVASSVTQQFNRIADATQKAAKATQTLTDAVEKQKKGISTLEAETERAAKVNKDFLAIFKKLTDGYKNDASIKKVSERMHEYRASVDSIRSSLTQLIRQEKEKLKSQNLSADALKKANKALDDQLRRFNTASNNIDGYQKAVTRMISTNEGAVLKYLQSMMRGHDGLIHKMEISAGKLLNTHSKIAKQFPDTIKKLNEQLSKGQTTYESALKFQDKLIRRYDQLSEAQKKAADEQKKVQNEFGKTKTIMEGLGEKIRSLSQYFTAATIIYQFVGIIRSAVSEVIEFDQALKNVQAISGAMTYEIKALSDSIKEIAKTTKYSSSEISNGLTLLTQAGLSTTEAMDAINATATLAAGTLSEMRESADLITTSIRSFGLDAKESGRVVDVMANAINKSKLDIDKLRTAFNYVGVAASQANLSLEQATATMMVMADVGIRASTIGTGFRQMLQKMIEPNEAFASALMAVGQNLDSINPMLVGYEKSLESLSRLMWDTEKNTVDMGKAFQFFELRASQGAAAVVRAFVKGDYQVAIEKLKEVGAASKMQATQMEGLAYQIKNLKDRFGVAMQAIGESGFINMFKGMAIAVRSLIEAMTIFFSSAAGKMVVKLGLILTGVIGITKVISSLGMLLPIATASMSKFALQVGLVAKNVGVAKTGVWLLHGAFGSMSSLPIVISGVVLLGLGLKKLADYSRESARKAAEATFEYRRMYEATSYYTDAIAAIEKSNAPDKMESLRQTIGRFNEDYKDLADRVMNYVGATDIATVDTNTFVKGLKEVEEILRREYFEKAAESLNKYGEELKKSPFLTFGKSAKEIIKENEQVQAEYNKQLRETINSLVDQVVQYKEGSAEAKAAEDAARSWIKTGIKSQEEATKMGETLTREIARTREHMAKTIDTYKSLIDQMPDEYKKMYQSLDILGKADFINFQKNLNNKVKEFEKNAGLMQMSEKEIAEATEAIRAKEHADWILKNKKRIDSSKMTETEVIGIIKSFQDKAIAEYNRGATTREETEKKVSGYSKALNEQYVSAVRTSYREVENIVKSHLERMRSQFDDIKNRMEQINQDITSLNQEYKDDMREIQQLTMTEEQKWLDDRKEAHRLLNEGIEKGDADLVKKAKGLFRSLAKEVKDENGNTVRALADTSSEARSGIESAHKAALSIMEKQKESYKNQLDAIKDNITSVEAKLESYKQKVAEVSNEEITLDASQVKDVLKDTLSLLDSVSKEPKNIELRASINESDTEKVKEIASDINGILKDMDKNALAQIDHFDEIKTKTDDLKDMLSDNKLDLDISDAEKDVNRLLAKLDKIGEPRQMKTGGKVGMATGGTVPGAGTGDIIPAMLTPGEFVNPVSSVKAYGVRFFEMLRHQLIPVDAVHSFMTGIRKFNMGGVVLSKIRSFNPDVLIPEIRAPRRFAVGGLATAGAGMGGSGAIADMGSITLMVGGARAQGVFNKDDLQRLKLAIEREKLVRMK